METFILENAKYQRKYKCPFCNYRGTRMDLVRHIDKKHTDLIPENYTSSRLVFNMINKKDHGRCIICGEETKWNENKCRYERLCGKKSCHDKYVKIAHDNTKIEVLLNDPNFQAKMLAGRRISGTYKFEDKGSVSYTGSYEKALLEFMDKFLHIKSYDVQAPGPVIEYDYNGKKHKWITDFYYIPFNLVFDVKDGGDNPNTREMTEYREKQVAKEKAIAKLNKYNYIRLTNNNFEQLILIMMELKELLSDDSNKKIIRINEAGMGAAGPAAGAIVSQSSKDAVYIVDKMKNNVFSRDNSAYVIFDPHISDKVFEIENGEVKSKNLSEFVDDLEEGFTVYECLDDINILEEIASVESGLMDNFYESITGKPLLDANQIRFDIEYFKESTDNILVDLFNSKQCIRSTIMESIMNKSVSSLLLEQYDDGISLNRDLNGVFLRNDITGLRTISGKTIDEINKLRKYL